MWADAWRDGPPCRIQMAPSAERRKVWLTPTARVPCSNAANMRKARLGPKVNFAHGKVPLRSKSRQHMCIVHQPKRRSNIVQSLVDLCWATSVNDNWVFKRVIFIQGPRYTSGGTRYTSGGPWYTSGGPRYTPRAHGTSKSPIPRYA